MRKILIALSMLVLSACATTYQPVDRSGDTYVGGGGS